MVFPLSSSHRDKADLRLSLGSNGAVIILLASLRNLCARLKEFWISRSGSAVYLVKTKPCGRVGCSSWTCCSLTVSLSIETLHLPKLNVAPEYPTKPPKCMVSDEPLFERDC